MNKFLLSAFGASVVQAQLLPPDFFGDRTELEERLSQQNLNSDDGSMKRKRQHHGSQQQSEWFASASVKGYQGKHKGMTSTEPSICEQHVRPDGSTVKHHAGTIPVLNGKQTLFYWFFESRNDPVNDPVMLWLTGGPGCSSMLALATENGPCSVVSGGQATKKNKYSWNSRANLLFVDQPSNTGFSTSQSSYAANSDDAATSMLQFLKQFFNKFDNFKENKFIISGESYAGHYIPPIAKLVHEDPSIKLGGVAIGNGWVNPKVQYQNYAKMVEFNKKSGVGSMLRIMMDNIEQPKCISKIDQCLKDGHKARMKMKKQSLRKQNSTILRAAHDFTFDVLTTKKNHDDGLSPMSCLQASNTCQWGLVVPVKLAGRNLYDLRIGCDKEPLCYDFADVSTYFNKYEVQQQLGVSRAWEECSASVHTRFSTLDFLESFDHMLVPLANDGVPLLIYAGEHDYICNWIGNEAWVNALDWSHQKDFKKANYKNWHVNNKTAGIYKNVGPLTFLKVHEAGHMVPMDQPEAALQMISSFSESTDIFKNQNIPLPQPRERKQFSKSKKNKNKSIVQAENEIDINKVARDIIINNKLTPSTDSKTEGTISTNTNNMNLTAAINSDDIIIVNNKIDVKDLKNKKSQHKKAQRNIDSLNTAILSGGYIISMYAALHVFLENLKTRQCSALLIWIAFSNRISMNQ